MVVCGFVKSASSLELYASTLILLVASEPDMYGDLTASEFVILH